MRNICRVAVLGAGTMGSRIAAHFANAGFPVLLLDLVLPAESSRNAAAIRGIENALKQRPVGFFTPAAAALVTGGNFDDDLGQIAGCDWIIEAVSEDLDIKRALLARVAAVRRPGTILSTNTSGIPLARMAEGFPEELNRHFLGTHFFNPPRYLHLVELIPGPATAPEILAFVSDFCDRQLGKGVVPCKDTPNFIANRIGCFFGVTTHRLTVEGDFTLEEADDLTGPLIGLPRSASYRLLDVIGLDVWAHVARNLYELAPRDPWRECFVLPGFLERMIERGWLGEKRGQGCYKRVAKGDGKEIWAVDRQSLDYRPARKASFPPVDPLRKFPSLQDRLRALIALPDRVGSFLWNLFSEYVLYSASLIPEITSRVVEIDRAMRWGYAHTLGPFELWDCLGLVETARRIEHEHRALPPSVELMLASGATSFYRVADEDRQPRTHYFDLAGNSYRTIEQRPGILALSEIKRARGTLAANPDASLIDLGDGVLGVECHGQRGMITRDTLEMIFAGIEETQRSFEAMVITGSGESFSAGLDGQAIGLLEQTCIALKHASKPVVAACSGSTLGAGCEIALHATRIQASAETFMGFPDSAVATRGGLEELHRRIGNAEGVSDLIAKSTVSTCAADARRLGLLRPVDRISMNPERLLGDAKDLALSLAPPTHGESRPDATYVV